VVASLVALIFAKDHLSIHTIISAVMIFIGVYFVSFKKTNIN
jgi:drug/metabolite transporter (DMT)-like permease